MDSFNPIISVIVPCYNYAKFLKQALDSVKNQTYSNWECLVIDDGSTDNTKEIVQKFYASDARFKYVFQQNKGLSAARNTGIKAAKGEFIQFLDADDYIAPLKLDTQIKTFLQNPEADIVYSDYKVFDDSKPDVFFIYGLRNILNEKDILEDFISNFGTIVITPPHTYLYRKSCFERWGYFNEEFRNFEDWDLYVRFALHKPKYIYIPGDFSFYRRHNQSICQNVETFLSWKIKVIKSHLKNKAYNNYYKHLLREQIHKRIGESAFDDMKKRNIFRGFKKLIIASWYSRNPFYYFYHGLYWLKNGNK